MMTPSTTRQSQPTRWPLGVLWLDAIETCQPARLAPSKSAISPGAPAAPESMNATRTKPPAAEAKRLTASPWWRRHGEAAHLFLTPGPLPVSDTLVPSTAQTRGNATHGRCGLLAPASDQLPRTCSAHNGSRPR